MLNKPIILLVIRVQFTLVRLLLLALIGRDAESAAAELLRNRQMFCALLALLELGAIRAHGERGIDAVVAQLIAIDLVAGVVVPVFYAYEQPTHATAKRLHHVPNVQGVNVSFDTELAALWRRVLILSGRHARGRIGDGIEGSFGIGLVGGIWEGP